MNGEKKLEVVTDGKFLTPSSMRIGIKEDAIQIEFGNQEDIEDKKEKFTILTAIQLNPKVLRSVVAELYNTGVTYEQKYNTDIGFLSSLKEKNDWGGQYEFHILNNSIIEKY